MSKGNIVYSTDSDWQEKCPECDNPLEKCDCGSKNASKVSKKTIYIKREIKGRRGKTVTTITNIGYEAKSVQKELQRLCGAGGTLKNGVIEIQGDHREKIKEFLGKKGFSAVLAGG